MNAAARTPDVVLPARSLIVAPRLPERPKDMKGGNPFDEDGDIVADCSTPGCGWHAMGPRSEIGAAVRDHHRKFHSEETSVMLLNQPRM